MNETPEPIKQPSESLIEAVRQNERERCARIAEEYECALMDYDGSIDAQRYYEGGVGDAATGIARAIRGTSSS